MVMPFITTVFSQKRQFWIMTITIIVTTLFLKLLLVQGVEMIVCASVTDSINLKRVVHRLLLLTIYNHNYY